MKAPQDRETPYKFDEWMDDGVDDTGVIPSVRAKGRENEIRFERKYPSDSRYSHAFSVKGVDGVRELRNFLDAWLESAEGDDETE